MPKKASTERGYMTKEEVYSELDRLKTDLDKARYFNRIFETKGLITPKTHKTIQKFADNVYKKVVIEAVKKGWFARAGIFAEKIEDKKLIKEIYGKIATAAAKKREFGVAGEFAEKAEEYLKQKHPGILAKIYEETGENRKARNLRKRLETKVKKR